MKLELKHLAPYLPYGLLINFHANRVEPINGLTKTEVYVHGMGWLNFSDFKPLLLPLSERKPFFDKYLSTFWSDFDYYVECIENGTLPYADVVQLLSEHFDVFGLIDAGLALNKNDYK